MSDYYFKLINIETGEIINEPNKPGELYIAGPSLMRGILNDPNPEYLITDDENVTWYKTNDLVSYDEKGWYKFIDRIDDVLNLSSGNLVNPNEIREVLEKYNIDNSIIFNTNGHKKDKGQDRVVLCIEYTGDDEDVELLKNLLEKEFALHLKSYEIPSEIVVFSQFPMNLNGKFLKNETKEKYFDNDYKLKMVLKK